MQPRDPYLEKAEPDDHFTMTDAVRAGERLVEAVHAFRDAYRALDVANGGKPDDHENYEMMIDLINGVWDDCRL
jgi:hypothetical protein